MLPPLSPSSSFSICTLEQFCVVWIFPLISSLTKRHHKTVWLINWKFYCANGNEKKRKRIEANRTFAEYSKKDEDDKNIQIELEEFAGTRVS